MEGLTQGSLLGDSSCLEMPSKINLQAVPEVVSGIWEQLEAVCWDTLI